MWCHLKQTSALALLPGRETSLSDNVFSSILSLYFHISNHGYHIVSLLIKSQLLPAAKPKTVMNVVANDNGTIQFLNVCRSGAVWHAGADVVHKSRCFSMRSYFPEVLSCHLRCILSPCIVFSLPRALLLPQDVSTSLGLKIDISPPVQLGPNFIFMEGNEKHTYCAGWRDTGKKTITFKSQWQISLVHVRRKRVFKQKDIWLRFRPASHSVLHLSSLPEL